MSRNIFVILAILYTFSIVKSISGHQYISDCSLYDGEYAGSSNLTFICTNVVNKNNFFVPNVISTCSKKRNIQNFQKYWVGTINFKDCEMVKIPNNIFEVYYNVHVLDVSNLGLTSLNVENFIKSENMTKLIASHNSLKKIPSKLFNESIDLAELDLSFNLISEIVEDAFNAKNSVEIINLSFNNISILNVQLFKSLANLHTLQLSHNKIVELPPLLFHSSDSLIYVDLSFNRLLKIGDFSLFGDVNLVKINLSFNEIKSFEGQVLEDHSHLTHLDISNNQITELKPDALESLQNLIYLDISNNALNVINNKTFLFLIKLQYLNLSQTLLSQLEPGIFLHQVNLQTLDLTNNFIKTLDSNILPTQLNQLKVLYIGNNQLNLLNGFTSSSYSKIVGITANRFRCSFLDPGTEIITWERLNSGSRQMTCHFYNESNQNGQEIELSSQKVNIFEVTTINAKHEKSTEQSIISTTVNGTGGHNSSNKNNSLKNNSLAETEITNTGLTTWINIVGFFIIVIALIWIIYRGNTIQTNIQRSMGNINNSYWKSDILPLDIADNSA